MSQIRATYNYYSTASSVSVKDNYLFTKHRLFCGINKNIIENFVMKECLPPKKFQSWKKNCSFVIPNYCMHINQQDAKNSCD